MQKWWMLGLGALFWLLWAVTSGVASSMFFLAGVLLITAGIVLRIRARRV